MSSESPAVPASFRDPSGFVFVGNGVLYRQVNRVYRENFELLTSSGLYARLTDAGLLVRHEVIDCAAPEPELAYRVIRPELIPFVSFPYEWCFSQLKEAALATLRIQELALKHGMVLKDASAYNIQFVDSRAVFIDTLSFEAYKEGEAWCAYQQFCRHFLAPLALMATSDVRLALLLRDFIDGIPLDLAAKLLPLRSRFNLPLLLHIHLHAKSQAKYSDSHGSEAGAKPQARSARMTRQALEGLIANLKSAVTALKWQPAGTEWGDYYSDTNYSSSAMQDKLRLVAEFVEKAAPRSLWDLGANTGVFSRVASERGISTVSFDIDPAAVEKNFRQCQGKKENHLLPLLLDLTNPSPALGWQHEERDSLIGRGPVDTVMALALIHHLAISNNVPLPKLARFFSSICRFLIIEFVPKSDSQVKRLLASRPDIFPNYDEEGFERAFAGYFVQLEARQVAGSERTLYLMQKI